MLEAKTVDSSPDTAQNEEPDLDSVKPFFPTEHHLQKIEELAFGIIGAAGALSADMSNDACIDEYERMGDYVCGGLVTSIEVAGTRIADLIQELREMREGRTRQAEIPLQGCNVTHYNA